MDCNFECAVQAIGVAEFDDLPKNPEFFTEISVPETVKIPHAKPDIEHVISVTIDAEIISLRLINTATGTSREGQFLSGHKLIVELKLRQKVKYVADEPTQKVHAAHFEKVISSVFIIVPDEMPVGNPPVPVKIEDLFNEGRLIVTPYIEDIYAVMRDKRSIFKNITILLDLTAR